VRRQCRDDSGECDARTNGEIDPANQDHRGHPGTEDADHGDRKRDVDEVAEREERRRECTHVPRSGRLMPAP
jgi:hypothetical protein